MAPSPPTGAPAEVAAGSGASYFKFDSRLDYYMQLAEESGLADDVSSKDGETQVQDTDMGEPAPAAGSNLPLPPAQTGVTIHEGESVASPGTHSLLGTPRLMSPSTRATPSLTSRAGAFQVTPDGQTSYFGPTSYLHLLHGPSPLWNRLAKRARVSSLDINRSLMPPEKRALESHLVNCFFTWDNLFLSSFDSNLYLRDKARYESGQHAFLYSPTLGYAILAVGQLYLTETDSNMADDLPDDFTTRARDLLNAELDSPSLSTVLTLIILCSLSAAEALDDQGWFYSGTALRLISGLGLDQEDSLFHPNEERNTLRCLQRDIVKGAICLDTIWRSWCGRVSDLTSPHLRSGLREEVGTVGFQEPQLAAESRFISLALIYRDLLSQEMSERGHLDQIRLALEQWKSSCPEYNNKEEPRTTALTIQSLMHYHGILLQLNRLWSANLATTQTSQEAAMSTASLAKCVESAKEISRLQQLFKQTYGLRRLHPLSIHPMLAASLINVHSFIEASVQSKEGRQARQNVLRSIQVFGEVAETFTVGSRALEIVMAVQHEWQHARDNAKD